MYYVYIFLVSIQALVSEDQFLCTCDVEILLTAHRGKFYNTLPGYKRHGHVALYF